MSQLAAGYRLALDGAAVAVPADRAAAAAPARRNVAAAVVRSPEMARRGRRCAEYDVPLPESATNLDDPALYFNRELSWLEFNRRVLELTEDTDGAAAGAAALLLDLRLEPGRVLHGAGGRAVRPDGRRDRRPRARRAAPAEQIDAIQRAGAGARPAAAARLRRRAAPGAGGRGHPHRLARRRQRGGAPPDPPPLPRAGLPGADAAGDRPRPALPLHLEPLAEPRGAAARPGVGGRDRRPGEGPEGAARALPAGRRGGDLRAARAGDRGQPRRALPGHRGGRPRLLPGHPRRRLHRLRRGRRPAAGGPGRAAPPPLRRGRAAGDRDAG